MTTRQELAEKLGLQNFRTFAQESAWKMAGVRSDLGRISIEEVRCRRSGRTTRVILDGLCRLANTDEPIWFAARSLDDAALMAEQAQKWATELGLDPTRIKFVGGPKAALGHPREQVFRDHLLHDPV